MAQEDFPVPGGYAVTLSSEFVLTRVQEGMLYSRRDEDPREIGSILVGRVVSSRHRVGNRVHITLGKTGDPRKLISRGRPPA